MAQILGNLDWQPARDHPDLVAPPVAAALAAHADLEVYVAPIDGTLADTAAFCAAYDVGMAESANCVVVQSKRGDVETMAAVMVLATHRADINKVVRKHLGAKKISFAAMDTATGLTDMEYGGITPVGLPEHWPVLVDEAAAEPEWVVIGSGIRASKLCLRGADLRRLPGAETFPLAAPVEG